MSALDDNLKEITAEEIGGDAFALTYTHSNSGTVLRLIAALRKCREQRDGYIELAHTMVGSDQKVKAAEMRDAELLAILEGEK